MAVLTLPFASLLVTIGILIHRGAIASLIALAALVATWSDRPVPAEDGISQLPRGLWQGRHLASLDVEIQSIAGTSVARGLVTYTPG